MKKYRSKNALVNTRMLNERMQKTRSKMLGGPTKLWQRIC